MSANGSVYFARLALAVTRQMIQTRILLALNMNLKRTELAAKKQAVRFVMGMTIAPCCCTMQDGTNALAISSCCKSRTKTSLRLYRQK
jgi:hypothetical protein